MKTKNIQVVVIGLIIFFFWLFPIYADDEIKAGKEIINQWQDTVITIKLVIKQRMIMEGREMNVSENKTEVTGTVIDPSGLVVLSLSTIDPSWVFKHFQFAGGGEDKFKWDTELTDVKMLLPDGRELAAKIVLRDRDLDLAFVRPYEKLLKPIPALDLSKDAKPHLLQQVVALGRLGKVASRAISVSLGRIQAIVEKPRTFYIPDLNVTSGATGAPVFTLDGKVAGVLLLRKMKSSIGMSGAFGGDMSRMGLLTVILPAADILEVAKQAK